jgi:hypothetical protein
VGFSQKSRRGMGGGVRAWAAFRLGGDDRWRRQRQRLSVRAWAALAAFGSGLDSFGSVRLRPGRRWWRSDWTAATFGFGRQFTGVEEQRVFCFLACIEEVVVCFVLFDFFVPCLRVNLSLEDKKCRVSVRTGLKLFPRGMRNRRYFYLKKKELEIFPVF